MGVGCRLAGGGGKRDTETTAHAGSAAGGGRGGRRIGARRGAQGDGGRVCGENRGGRGCGMGLVNPSRAFVFLCLLLTPPCPLSGLALLVHTTNQTRSPNQTKPKREGGDEMKREEETTWSERKKKNVWRLFFFNQGLVGLGVGRSLWRAAGFEGRAGVGSRLLRGAPHRNTSDPTHAPTHFYPSIGLQRPLQHEAWAHGPTPALRR